MPRGFCELRRVDRYDTGRTVLFQREFDVCLLDCGGIDDCGLAFSAMRLPVAVANRSS